MPVKEAIGGLPDEIFQPQKAVVIKGLFSDRNVRYWMEDREIFIEDQENGRLHFYAQLHNSGVLYIDVQTRGEEVRESLGDTYEVHPDLYARQLIIRAVDYFQAQGLRVKGIAGNWYPDGNSINAVEFLNAVEAGVPEVEAAKTTWTGKLASELGFPRVEYVRRIPHRHTGVLSRIEALFTR